MRSRIVALAFCFTLPIVADDLDRAPKAVDIDSQHYVPIDILSMHTKMVFDAESREATGEATMQFVTREKGRPLFDLVPQVLSATLDDQPIAQVLLIQPDASTRMRSLSIEVEAGQTYTFKVSYKINNGVEYASDGIKIGFFMSDLAVGGREYWEAFGLAGLEYDQYPHHIDAEIVGTSKSYRMMTNGEVENMGRNQWSVDYPDYFTTSSLYFHIIDPTRFKIKSGTFAGINGEVPVTVYAASESNASQGLANTLKVLKELEATYGAYAHASALAYITPDGGGMEYCGATITSLWALEHEFTHSWFARGVMPANGNSGWIDEAIASWRDNNYPRLNQVRSRGQLSGFPEFQRHTVMPAYTHGANVIANLDAKFASVSGGMKPLLKQLFSEFQRSTITVEIFRDWLEEKTGVDLDSLFNTHVFSRAVANDENAAFTKWTNSSRHPRPFTKEELQLYR